MYEFEVEIAKMKIANQNKIDDLKAQLIEYAKKTDLNIVESKLQNYATNEFLQQRFEEYEEKFIKFTEDFNNCKRDYLDMKEAIIVFDKVMTQKADRWNIV